MIRVRVKSFQTRRLDKLKDDLQFTSSSELFRTLPLAEFQRRALEYIESITPLGRRSEYYEELGVKANKVGDQPLKGSWRIRRIAEGNSIQFEIYSKLEVSGGKRGKAKVEAIEGGNRAGSFIAKRDFKFFSTALDRWTYIREGDEVRRPARAGKHIVSRTAAFIQAFVAPDARDKIETILKNRLRT